MPVDLCDCCAAVTEVEVRLLWKEDADVSALKQHSIALVVFLLVALTISSSSPPLRAL